MKIIKDIINLIGSHKTEKEKNTAGKERKYTLQDLKIGIDTLLQSCVFIEYKLDEVMDGTTPPIKPAAEILCRASMMRYVEHDKNAVDIALCDELLRCHSGGERPSVEECVTHIDGARRDINAAIIEDDDHKMVKGVREAIASLYIWSVKLVAVTFAANTKE